jgi:hypothetical protein
MSRSTNRDLIDRLRLAISALLGRPARPAPAYVTVEARHHPCRPTHPGR